MPEPTLIAYGETAWNTTGTSKSASAVSWLTGDLIVVASQIEDAAGTVSVANQLGLTFANGGVVGTSGATCGANTWSATATSDQTSVQVAVTAGDSTRDWGAGVWVYRDHGGIGARATDITTAKTVSLARGGNNSHVIGTQGDYSAAATSGYAFTPTVGNEREVAQVSGRYSVYAADWSDQGAAGSTSYGTSGETSSGTFAKIALEILGPLPTDPMPVTYEGAGAYSTSGDTTPLTLPVPTNLQGSGGAGMVAYALILVKADTATVTAANWAQDYFSGTLGTGTPGTGVGVLGLRVMKRVVPAGGLGTTVDFTIGNTPNSYMGVMVGFSYDATGFTDGQWAALVGTTYTRTTASTTFGGTGAANLNLGAGDYLVFTSLSTDDQSSNHNTTTFDLNATGITLTGLANLGTGVTTTGGDSSMLVGHAGAASGTESAAPSSVAVSNSAETGGGVFLRVRAVGNVAGDYTGEATRSETFTVTAAGVVARSSGASRSETITTTATGSVGKRAGAAVALGLAITATGTVGSAAYTGTATRAETISVTAAGLVGKQTGTSRPETIAITTAGAVGKRTGTTRPLTDTITAAGAVGKRAGASVPLGFAVTATGVVGKRAPTSVPLSFAVTATGSVTSGLSAGASRPETIAITATGRADHSTGTSRPETIAITASGHVAGAKGASRPETITITATGRAAHSAGASRPLSITITAAGTVGASGTGQAQRPLAITITATGKVAHGAGAARSLAQAITATGRIGKQTGVNRPLTATITATGRLGKATGAARPLAISILATGTKATSAGASRPLTFAITATGHASTSLTGTASRPLVFAITAAGVVYTVPPGTAVQGPDAHTLLYAGSAQILNNGGGARILSGPGSAQIMEA